ncbi:MAG: hypothetical protein ACI35T_05430 [Alistipes sp.]
MEVLKICGHFAAGCALLVRRSDTKAKAEPTVCRSYAANGASRITACC